MAFLWLSILFAVKVQGIYEADILMASDSRWSDVDQEDIKLQQGFEAHGFVVSKMSGFTTGSLSTHLSQYRLFVYPEAELGKMSDFFNDDDFEALSSWVSLGGSWLSVMNVDSIHMINTVFGWSLEHQTSNCGTPAERVGNILNEGPSHLNALDATQSVRMSSLPSEVTCVYQNGACCWVFVANIGAGVVSWLGYDWHPKSVPADLASIEVWNEVASTLIDSKYAAENSCHWISIDLTSKDIQGSNFFGYECPSREFIAAIKVQRYQSQSHLHNNPVEVKCCELSGTHHVTATCVDNLTQDTGTAEDALCEGTSVLSGIYNSVNPLIAQNQLEYDQTMAHRCCEVSECEADYCNDGNGLSIDQSSCTIIGHESEPESDGELSTLSCPSATVLKKIIDADVAIGVQQVYEIECCDIVQVAPPSSSPTVPPSNSPSLSPTTTCMNCLMTLHKEDIDNDLMAISRYQDCLDNHCCA